MQEVKNYRAVLPSNLHGLNIIMNAAQDLAAFAIASGFPLEDVI